ncbi:MAG: DsrE family protein [candidate division NC10 bacterium]|nr:DsrE family protein [candidate division NC10 bacterium]
MPKRFTLFLSAPPYASEHAATAARLAGAALDEGHQVTLFASGDGVYNFLTGQGAKGVPNAESEFAALMARGLTVEL